MSSENDGVIMSTPSVESPEKPSSPESKRKKTSTESVKVLEMDQSATGLADTKKNPSPGRGKGRSLKKGVNLMPVPRFRPKQDRGKEALKRLGVSQEDVENAQQVTDLLKYAEGGLKAVLAAMRFASQNETIRIFLQKYDSIPSGDREKLPWEAIVIAAELESDTFFGAASFAVANYASNKSKIILSSSHPKVTQARVAFALLPGGEKDRFAIDTMVGALPSPKGPTFIGKAIFGGASQTANEKDDDDSTPQEGVFVDTDNLDSLFPPSADMQEKLIAVRQKMLE